MKKNRKTLLCVGLLLLTGSLTFGLVNEEKSQSKTEVKAIDELPLNTFAAVQNGWNPNPTDFEKGYCHYVFNFKNKWGSDSDRGETNLVSTTGQGVYLNGRKLSEIGDPDAKVSYAHGGNFFAVKIKKDLIVAAEGLTYATLDFEEGTPFFNYALPELSFRISLDTYVCSQYLKPIDLELGKQTLNEFRAIAGGWNPNETLFSKGSCEYVFEFKNEWGSATDKSDANLVNSVGQYVFLNGQKLSDISDPDAKIHYGHGGKYLAVRLNKNLIVPAAGKTICELTFTEGIPFFNYDIPKLNMEIDCSTYVCTVIKDPTRLTFEDIVINWRNTIWGEHNGLLESQYEPNPIIDNDKAYPTNGYCVLFTFNPNNDRNKFSDEQNFAYDPNYEFSTKMKVNGVQVKDVEGVKVNGILGYLYIYICDETLPNKDIYQYPTIDFESGIRMGDIIFPKMAFEYIGKIGKSGDWRAIKVSNKGIVWNKENKDSELFGDKKGILVGLDKDVYEGTSENLVVDLGIHAKLNGKSFVELTNAEIRFYDCSNIWLYADEMNTVNEELNVLHFDSISYNNEILDSFDYYRQSGDNSYWSSRTSDARQQLTIKYNADRDYWGSDWPSGHVYLGEGHHEYCGGNYKSGTKEGYLLSFNERISNVKEEQDGKFKYINLVKENIGHHIYSKGVPLCDIEGAEIMYHSTGNLWIWEPNMARPYEGKNYAQIRVEGGTLFFDSELPEINIYHEDYKNLGNFTNGNPWRIKGYKYEGKLYEGPISDHQENYLTLDEKTPDPDTWLGPFGWNNHDGDGTLLICYGHNASDVDAKEEGIETTYLKEDKQPNMFNVGTKDFSIGWKLKFNGMPIWQIEGSSVSYMNGENYLSINIPVKFTIPFNGYKVPTLTLEDGANFHDVSLQGFELYFNSNGKWQKEFIPSVSDDLLNSAIKFTDVFNNTVFTKDLSKAEGIKNVSSNDFAFEFTSNDSNAAFALNLFGKDKNHGLNVVVDLNNDTFILLDNSNGSKQLGDGIYSFAYTTGEWNRFYLSASFNGNMLDVIVAIDDTIIADIKDVEVGNIDNFGNVMYLYTNQTNIEFSDVRTSGSIKRPKIVYTGKNLYRFNVGDEMPDILPLFSATDMLNDITSSIVLDYSEGMFDENGKLTKGDHVIKAIATSSIGISSTKEIRVLVTSPDEVVVTFDGNNPKTYKIGDKIEKPENPTKPSIDGLDYVFAYWEYNGEEWDFDNYYVTQDVNLVSKFNDVKIEYTITFNTEGLPTNYSLDFKFILGANISFDFFNKEGYTFEVFNGEQKVSSYTVNGNGVLTVKYSKVIIPVPDPDPEPKPEKKGCGGSIEATSVITSVIALGSVLLISLRKKEEK